METKGQPTVTIKEMYKAPDRFRQETPGGFVVICNGGKSLLLIASTKQAVLTPLPNAPKGPTPMDFFAEFEKKLLEGRDKPDAKRKSLGEKEIDGHRAIGYSFAEPGENMELWGDAKSGLPIRVELTMADCRNMKVTISDFAFNGELAESLFSLDPPAGYKVETRATGERLATEKDLIESLGRYCDFAGGDFPDGLDESAVAGAIVKDKTKLAHGGRDATEEEKQKVADLFKKVHGFAFALRLPADADAHYAGKGLSRGTADKPILWYKPKGDKKYRVIYANLSVRDAQKAPSVLNAQPVPGKPGTGK